MTIETKFDVSSEVFFIDNGEINSAFVECISCEVNQQLYGNIDVGIWYKLDNKTKRPENKLFRNIDELAAHYKTILKVE